MKAHPNHQSSDFLRKWNRLSLFIKPRKIQAIFQIITIFFLSSCSSSTIQEAVTPIHPTATALPSPLPTQTPEPTAIPTSVPDPYRINAGFLERWDGTAYQQIVEASSYHVNDVDNWIIAFDPDGVPITIFEITTQLSVPVVDSLAVVNGVPYRYNAEYQTWTAQLFALSGGNVQAWDREGQTYVPLTDLANMPIEAVDVVQTENGWLAARNAGGEIVLLTKGEELLFVGGGQLLEWCGQTAEVNLYEWLPEAVRQKPEKMQANNNDLWLTPEEMKLRVGELLPKEMGLSRLEVLPNGAIEGYDNSGNLLLVKPAEDQPWVVAPVGYRLWESRWQKWERDTATWTEEWNIPGKELTAAQERIAQLVDERLLTKEFRPGEMQFISKYFSYHMDVNPEKARQGFLALLKAMVNSSYYPAAQYWRDLGFTSGMTEEQLWERLQQPQFTNDAGEPGWLPAVTEQGNEFLYLQDDHNAHTSGGYFKPNRSIIDANTYLLDGVYVAVFSPSVLSNNSLIRSWIAGQGNTVDGGWEDLLGDRISIDQINNVWGFVHHKRTRRLIFLVGNPKLLPNGNENHIDSEQFGGRNLLFSAGRDPKLASAYLDIYLQAFVDSVRLGTNSTHKYCISANHYNTCDVVITPSEAMEWFVPIN